ncbi:hypothetical protein GCM10007424_12610 [Flavobacterium suaedae]|uniref:Uncharacterized protein n=1 Tax=Flavobacterium suaedae TaxID=1767027 RepID=A0ABQ1JTC3_9FLAO|nr:hypothetical protein [Flavobacterium suaedae]GGB74167.1 hypothetical protein GCM10007424_12610 [Flavobacterium suaedae]
MNPGTDDPKDLGSKKWNNEEKESKKNEGFSGENLPKNYNPSKDKMTPEVEKDEEGSIDTVKRARDVNEKKAAPVSEISDKATRNGETVDKSRGTKNEDEAMETAKNRDFNSDIEKDRYNLEDKNK